MENRTDGETELVAQSSVDRAGGRQLPEDCGEQDRWRELVAQSSVDRVGGRQLPEDCGEQERMERLSWLHSRQWTGLEVVNSQRAVVRKTALSVTAVENRTDGESWLQSSVDRAGGRQLPEDCGEQDRWRD